MRSSRRSSSRRRALALACVAALGFGCAAHDFYRSYAEAHPGWVPELPRDRISLEELLAAIHAPPRGRNTTTLVTHLELLDIGVEPWATVPLDSLRDGSFEADSARSYVVAAQLECLYASRSYRRDNREVLRRSDRAFVWYAIRDERLLGYEHVSFEERCRAVERSRGRLKYVEGFEAQLRDALRSWE